MTRTIDTYRGTRVWSNKLTEEQVREIRRRYNAGRIGTQRLANDFGVSKSNIRAIVTGKTWKELLSKEENSVTTIEVKVPDHYAPLLTKDVLQEIESVVQKFLVERRMQAINAGWKSPAL